MLPLQAFQAQLWGRPQAVRNQPLSHLQLFSPTPVVARLGGDAKVAPVGRVALIMIVAAPLVPRCLLVPVCAGAPLNEGRVVGGQLRPCAAAAA